MDKMINQVVTTNREKLAKIIATNMGKRRWNRLR